MINIPNILNKLKQDDLEFIEEIKILIIGGIPTSQESVLGFKNKSFKLQEKISYFRNGLYFLYNSKKIEIQKYEGNELEDKFNFNTTKKSKIDKKSELLNLDNQYYDLNLSLLEYDALLKYSDDLYFIIKQMTNNI